MSLVIVSTASLKVQLNDILPDKAESDGILSFTVQSNDIPSLATFDSEVDSEGNTEVDVDSGIDIPTSTVNKVSTLDRMKEGLKNYYPIKLSNILKLWWLLMVCKVILVNGARSHVDKQQQTRHVGSGCQLPPFHFAILFYRLMLSNVTESSNFFHYR